MLENTTTESRRYRRCPKSGLLCIVCPRSGSCLVDSSERSRADFQELFASLDAPRCPTCRLKYFGACKDCNPQTSFPDHRVGAPRSELYPTVASWREVNGEREQSVPDRKVQP